MKSLDCDERRTVDGTAVKKGDRVWRTYCAGVTSRVLTKSCLGNWTWQWLGKELYSTESAALSAALAVSKKDLAKAKTAVRRATKAIERLTARLGRQRDESRLGRQRDESRLGRQRDESRLGRQHGES
jgi:hypothetical protein